MWHLRRAVIWLVLVIGGSVALGAESSGLFVDRWALTDSVIQRDFFDMCLDASGMP